MDGYVLCRLFLLARGSYPQVSQLIRVMIQTQCIRAARAADQNGKKADEGIHDCGFPVDDVLLRLQASKGVVMVTLFSIMMLTSTSVTDVFQAGPEML